MPEYRRALDRTGTLETMGAFAVADPSVNSAAVPRRFCFWSHPLLHGAGLAVVGAVWLALSWRKWADPVVDFGRELYIPWRLAEGAVLYRDVEDFYGPLSQYLNAALFRIFGPGLMVLVAANLVVFTGITAATYVLVRRAWGAGAAFAASAGLITVFGFSRFVFAGNFNYATPYAHEASHGVLVLLGLTAVWCGWLERPTRARLAAAGLLCGLTLVLKAEVVLAAAAVSVAAVLLARWRGAAVTAGWAGFVVAAIAPTAGFMGWFARDLPWRDAAAAAGRAWLNVLGTTRYIADPAQFFYAGLDQPWLNLGWHVLATGLAAVAVGALAAVTWLFERRGMFRWAGPAAVAAGLGLVVACVPGEAKWFHVGRCFLGLLAGYGVYQVWRIRRAGPPDPATAGRLLLLVLGMALMARMVLAGRIYQFGPFQAALAGVVLLAVLFGELPALAARTRAGRRFFVLVAAAMLLPGLWALTEKNLWIFRNLTLPMGRGSDQLMVFRVVQPVVRMLDFLSRLPPGQTMLVLPEGLMLNYLARIPSPAPHFFYYSAVTENGAEARLVERLQQRPPDLIVTMPRDLREYGISQYGVRPGAGGDLLAWMRREYDLHGWAAPEDYAGPAPDPGAIVYSTDYLQVFTRKGRGIPGASPGPGAEDASRPR